MPPNFRKDKEGLLKILKSFDKNNLMPVSLAKSSLYDHLLILVLMDVCCSFVIPDDAFRKNQLFEALKEQLNRDKVLPNLGHMTAIRLHASKWFMNCLQKTCLGIGNPMSAVSSAQVSNFFSARIYPNTYEQNFEEVGVIASGGFGTVCKAVHKIDQVAYAVKKIYYSIDHEVEAEKVLSEALSLSALGHANVVSYKNCWVQLVGGRGEGGCCASRLGDFSCSESWSGFLSEGSSSDSLEDANACIDQLEELSSLTYSEDSLVQFDFGAFQRAGGNSSSGDATKCSSWGPCAIKHQPTNQSSSGEKAMLCIQMEYCDWDLNRWLEDRASGKELPFAKDVRDIFRDVVQGVVHVHSKSIIHRDLKPSNIFYSERDGFMKIGDFGLATLSHAIAGQTKGSGGSRCHTSNLGTFPYMAPEQRVRSDYDEKVDIYSLGVILVELLIPFKTRAELGALLADPFPRLARCFPQYVDLVENLLQVNPELRMSAKEILNHPLLTDSAQVEKLLVEIQSLKLSLERKEQELEAARQEIDRLEAEVRRHPG